MLGHAGLVEAARGGGLDTRAYISRPTPSIGASRGSPGGTSAGCGTATLPKPATPPPKPAPKPPAAWAACCCGARASEIIAGAASTTFFMSLSCLNSPIAGFLLVGAGSCRRWNQFTPRRGPAPE
ncbi:MULTISPECIES: hypothetical protein [unclassified Micromonospora]|uniref:hypothetical protein n=1 Tax=unclassified Micromonospora TaxID=2617518 RepID=UPI00362560CE